MGPNHQNNLIYFFLKMEKSFCLNLKNIWAEILVKKAY